MKILGDPAYRALNVAIIISAVPLAISFTIVALTFMADDWLFAHCPKYRNHHS